MHSRLILTLFAFLTFPLFGFAACSDPAGDEGAIVYNKTYKIPVFCNGTDWIAWGSGGSGTGGDVPSGFIGAFNLSSCPTGWSEYTAARGRFLRGIDSTGTVDPGGVRVAGSTQEDEFKSHTHTAGDARDAQGNGNNSWFTHSGSGDPKDLTIGATGGDETRPKNVAVLFCEKD